MITKLRTARATYIEALVRPILLIEVQEVHPAAVGQVDRSVVADEEGGREGADEADPLRVGVRLGPLIVDLCYLRVNLAGILTRKYAVTDLIWLKVTKVKYNFFPGCP